MTKRNKEKTQEKSLKITEKEEQQATEINKSEQEAKEEKKSTKEETVTIPLKDFASQLEEIDQLKGKINQFSEGWQRERADFDNYRKRIKRDQEKYKQDIKVEIIKKYLVIHDDIELAFKNAPHNKENNNWTQGINLILKKLKGILDDEGVQLIPAEHRMFDPNLHEAISSEDNSELESGQIIEVIKQGYIIGDRVIRPALVRVAK